VGFPEVVVVAVDNPVGVAIGAEVVRSENTSPERVLPHRIVGGIDEAVEIVIAGKRIGLKLDCADVDAASIDARKRSAALVELWHSACDSHRRGIAGVDGWAVRKERMCQNVAAVRQLKPPLSVSGPSSAEMRPYPGDDWSPIKLPFASGEPTRAHGCREMSSHNKTRVTRETRHASSESPPSSGLAGRRPSV
jgi:hypothetical protein